MNSLIDAFFNKCVEKFQFLIEQYAFKQIAKKAEAGVYRIIYKNKTTAVEVGLEWREQYIYVELYRLIEGRIKNNPIIIRPETELTAFNLEDLLETRAPELKLPPDYFGRPLTIGIIENALARYAFSVKKYAADILQGDFGAFDKLESIVKGRLTDNPEESIIAVSSGEDDKIENSIEALVKEMVERKISFKDTIAEFEKQIILSALKQTEGNSQKAAQLLHMPHNTIAKFIKLKKRQTV